MSLRKSAAREAELEEAAALMVCLMSVTERVVGSIRRSRENVLAMPPVAVWWKGLGQFERGLGL